MKANKECLTILIDLASHLEASHSFIYSRAFRMAYKNLNLDYVYISPSAREAFESDCLLFGVKEEDYLVLDKNSIISLDEEIFNLMDRNQNIFFHVYFLWGHQIPYSSLKLFMQRLKPFWNNIEISFNYKLPYLLGRLDGPELAKERNFLEAVETLRIPFTLHVYDRKANEVNHTNISYLNEPIVFDSERNELRVTLSKTPNCISFFGGLTFERGLGDFLVLALFNPFIKFKIIGNGEINRSFYRHKKYLSKYQTPFYWVSSLLVSYFFKLLTSLPNVGYSPNYIFEEHVDLETSIAYSECIYASTIRSGIESGIARLALHFGTPVITKDSEGLLHELLTIEFAIGRIGNRTIILRNKLRAFVGKKHPRLTSNKGLFINDIAKKCIIH